VCLTRECIESLAPDQASLAAALKLVKATPRPVLVAGADRGLLWGRMPRLWRDALLIVSLHDVGYSACKHVLAVLSLRVDKPERFEMAWPPWWVEEWRARRRPGGGRPRANDGASQQYVVPRGGNCRLACRSAADGSMRLWRASTTLAQKASAAADSPALHRAEEGLSGPLPRTPPLRSSVAPGVIPVIAHPGTETETARDRRE
jgi:hypothetical protein